VFIAETRRRGATPVFVTPMERRSNGDTVGPWARAMRDVAARENVPLIDQWAMSKELWTALGQNVNQAFATRPISAATAVICSRKWWPPASGEMSRPSPDSWSMTLPRSTSRTPNHRQNISGSRLAPEFPFGVGAGPEMPPPRPGIAATNRLLRSLFPVSFLVPSAHRLSPPVGACPDCAIASESPPPRRKNLSSKTGMNLRAIALLLAGALAPFPPPSASAAAPVALREADEVIPTYQSGAPDPNPMFYFGRDSQGAEGRIYPYPLYDNLTNRKSEQTYHIIYLENEYVRIGIAPELGGRLFSGAR
jgi:hypothetical protein